VGKYETNWILHTSKIGNLLPICLRKKQASSRPHFRAACKALWKTLKNCVRNRCWPDEIDTETEICTSLKSEFYFRFRWPQSTKSTMIVISQFGIFVTICGKICPPQSRNWKNWISHTSKIGNLLPVCLRNNTHLAQTTFPSRTQKFVENGKKIADVIGLDRKKSIPKPKFAPL